jgi:hypothetical protein
MSHGTTTGPFGPSHPGGYTMTNGYDTTANGYDTTSYNGFTTTATPPPQKCCVMVNTINGRFEIDILHEKGEERDLPIIGNIPIISNMGELVAEAFKAREWELTGRISVLAQKMCLPCEYNDEGELVCESEGPPFGPAPGCEGSEFPPYKIKCEDFIWPPSRDKRIPGQPHNARTNPYVPASEEKPNYAFSFDCAKSTSNPSTPVGALNQVNRKPKKPVMCIHQVEVIKCEGPCVGCCTDPPCNCPEGVIDTSPKVFNPDTGEWEPEEIKFKIGFSGRGPGLSSAFGAIPGPLGDVAADLTGQGCTDKFLREFELKVGLRIGQRVGCDCKKGKLRSLGESNKKWPNMLPMFGDIADLDVREFEDAMEHAGNIGWDLNSGGPNSNEHTSDDKPCGC